jgi:RNA polymerase-interacting CarD/CdnL/TRCF family regulator
MYKIGDIVHYPGHGICTIKTIFDKDKVNGGPTYILKPINASFKFQGLVLTHKKAKDIGVHYLINKDEAEKVYEILKENPSNLPKNRMKAYLGIKEKIYSGDIFKVTEAIRDLEDSKDIFFILVKSSLEHKAKKILIDELSEVNDISPKEAADSINKTLLKAKEERKKWARLNKKYPSSCVFLFC